MNKYVLFFLGIVFILYLSATSAKTAELTIAFGDSITEGHCRGYCNAYPEILETVMNADGRSANVLNAGLGGEVTKSGVSRINIFLAEDPDYSINNHCPPQNQFNHQRGRIILIMEGANDVIHGISVQTTLQNLQIMVDKSLDAGLIPVLATITPNYKYHFGSCNSGVMGPYNNAIRNLAANKGIVLADQCNATNSIWASINCDGLHPTEYGDHIIANTWYSVMPEEIHPLNGQLFLLLGH